MPMAHDIGTSLFVQVMPYPIKGFWPLVEVGQTQEIEGDYRSGKSLVIRFPRQKALVVGRWTRSLNDEEDALSTALRAREVDVNDLDFPEADDVAA